MTNFIPFDENSKVAFLEKRIILIQGATHITGAIMFILGAFGFVIGLLAFTSGNYILILSSILMIGFATLSLMFYTKVDINGINNKILITYLLNKKEIFNKKEIPFQTYSLLLEEIYYKEGKGGEFQYYLYLKEKLTGTNKYKKLITFNSSETAFNFKKLAEKHSQYFDIEFAKINS